MSAYVPNQTHIASMVRAARDHGRMPGRSNVRWFSEEPWKMIESGTPYLEALHATQREVAPYEPESWARAAALLTTAVVASVKYRYPEDTDASLPGAWTDGSAWWTTTTPEDWERRVKRAPVYEPAAMLKAVSGYEYQACELPGWRGSEAHAFCQALRDALVSDLPGYDEGPWEIEDDAQPGPMELMDMIGGR